MKAHRNSDPHGASEEAKARARGGHTHRSMLMTGGASRHERKDGGSIPGKGKIEAEERKDDEEPRKRGGKVHGSKPKERLDKRARGGRTVEKEHEAKRAKGGRMTPGAPLTGAGGHKPPFEHAEMPLDDHGEGTVSQTKPAEMKRARGGRAMGGPLGMPPRGPLSGAGQPPPNGAMKDGGRKKRATGGRMFPGVGKETSAKRKLEDADSADTEPGRTSGGRLSAGERRRLPSSDFALPGHGEGLGGKGSGSYPIPNASHARNALARVAQHGSPAEQATVRRRVHEKFPEIGRA